MGEKLAADGESGLNISPLPRRDSAQTPPKKTKPVAQTAAKAAPRKAPPMAQRAAKAKPSGGAEATAVRTDKPAAEKAAEKAADGKAAKTTPAKSTPTKGAKVIVALPLNLRKRRP